MYTSHDDSRTHEQRVRACADALTLIRQIKVGATASEHRKANAATLRIEAQRLLEDRLTQRYGSPYKDTLLAEATAMNERKDYEYSLSRRRSQPFERQI